METNSSDSIERLLPKELNQDLTPAEEKLLREAHTGEPIDFRVNDESLDDPENSKDWGADRTIRASILFWLYTNPRAYKHLNPKGICLNGAFISEKLDFSNCILQHSISLENCFIENEIMLDNAQLVKLTLKGSHFKSIWGAGLVSKGGVSLINTKSQGEIIFSAAKIGCYLNCDGAVWNNPGGYALKARNAVITGDVSFGGGFQSFGELNLYGAKINGLIAFFDAMLENNNNCALNAKHLIIEGSIFLCENFIAKGMVDFANSVIKGSLLCHGASLSNPDDYALIIDNAKIHNFFNISDVYKLSGGVNLENAQVNCFVDDGKIWSNNNSLLIHGFKYESLDSFCLYKDRVNQRLKWFKSQSRPKRKDKKAEKKDEHRFGLQPFIQLSNVYKSMGYASYSKSILIAMEEYQRKRGELRWFSKFINWLLGWTIGHGYRPERIIYFLMFFILLGWGVFGYAESLGIMQSISDQNCYSFSPIIYSIDVLAPIFNLHQANFYSPTGLHSNVLLFQIYLLIHTIIGWVISSLIIIVLSRLIREK